jgi:hypothetical protein
MEQSGTVGPFKHLNDWPSIVIFVSERRYLLTLEIIPHDAGLIEDIHWPGDVEAGSMARIATFFISPTVA